VYRAACLNPCLNSLKYHKASLKAMSSFVPRYLSSKVIFISQRLKSKTDNESIIDIEYTLNIESSTDIGPAIDFEFSIYIDFTPDIEYLTNIEPPTLPFDSC
jgi:hypothetical protein